MSLGRTLLGSVAALALASLAGCGPYLRTEIVSVRAFEAPERCGQGPYEIVVPARGARWGEGVEVHAYSPREIDGLYEVSAGAEVVAEGRFARRWVPVYDGSSSSSAPGYVLRETSSALTQENERCISVAAERALEGGSVHGGAPIAAPGVPGEMAARPGEPIVAHVPSAPELTLRSVTWERRDPQLTPSELHGEGRGVLRFGAHTFHPRDPENDPMPPLPAGAEIRIRFWSIAPNDLERVTFVLAHTVQVPSVPDDEWIAHLRRAREEREREWARQQAETQRRSDEWTAHCHAHHEDEQCWGPGGYQGAVERERRAAADAPRLEAERRAREAERASHPPPAAAPPSPAEPEGPPPPPRADPRPPRPSERATWVSGYWRWHAGLWVWIAGAWDVPPEDVAEARTVRAPEAPPPPRAETPPAAPAPGMVWVAGYWQWDGARFVWIAGRWDLPRDQGASWTAPSWRVDPGGAVFVPGRWELRFRR